MFIKVFMWFEKETASKLDLIKGPIFEYLGSAVAQW